MPVYNGMRYITESIESIKNQTFQDWEMIIVNEFGSDDGCREVIEGYAEIDSRFRLIQNSERLGLAESLNVGLRAATGELIARVDVDDPSYPDRLEKQVQYLDNHQNVALCGTLQRSVLPNDSNVESVKTEYNELVASMLFGCEISHCSVMFRRKLFAENDWWYDKDSLCEDYDLWTKIMFKVPIVNIDEVLVDHRWGFDNISIEKGESLREATREVSKRTLKACGIDIEKENIDIHVLAGWRSKPMDYIERNKVRFIKDSYRLLILILNNKQLQEAVGLEALRKVMLQRWNWVCACCNIAYNSDLNIISPKTPANEPLVSVVLPVYNSAAYLRLAIESVLEQTYSTWELLLVNEMDSDDGSREICKFYELLDNRVHFIQNEEKLGLAESLNKGMRQARGQYIARLDADDLAHSDRFAKQVRYLETNKNVGICGSWQHHFGTTDWIHKPAEKPEQCRANLLFWCDLCHSTLMLRKSVIDKYDLYFDNSFLAEDYELWTRALRVTEIANIPEVLGEYRVGDDNITNSKFKALRAESGKIVCDQLKTNLGIIVPEEDYILFSGWGNAYFEVSKPEREQMLQRLQSYIYLIWETNKKVRFYDKDALLTVLNSRWKQSARDEQWSAWENPYSIERVFDKGIRLQITKRFRRLFRENRGLKNKLRKIGKKCFSPFVSSFVEAQKDLIINNNSSPNKDMFYKLQSELNVIKKETYQLKHMNQHLIQIVNKNSLQKDQKIRIAFLFQVASFWPSWESFYKECIDDDRIEVKLVWLNQTIVEKYQMITAHDFLETNGLDYIDAKEFNFEEFAPHVVVYQTPYDCFHRKYEMWSENMIKKGVRIVYIPYGIEIADTNDAHKAHFEESVIKNSWRIYTFSKAMLSDYQQYCQNKDAVRALGLPRLDAYHNREQFKLNKNLRERIGNRKIVLWKVHFPKEILIKNEKVQVTPNIQVYLDFVEYIEKHKNIFFIFMPHPRFLANDNNNGNQIKAFMLIDRLQKLENVFIDYADDYRNSLSNADAIIVDRSAVMIEAGAMGAPVMYMYNKVYDEPMVDALRPLVDSYYKGVSSKDMQNFVDMVMAGKDYLKEKRKKAFSLCMPFDDGKCGERIKDDIVNSLYKEMNESAEYRLAQENARLQEQILLMQERFDKFAETEEMLWQKNDEQIESLMKRLDARIWKSDLRNKDLVDETHRHIDFTYRDIMVALQQQKSFLPENDVVLETEYPVAYESLDHLYPHGTIRDNTRYPRFVEKCEELLQPKKDLAFLDLGCSGGGMVLEAALRGHLSIGLEGSDCSKKEQRAEWRLLGDRLQTCDITKSFCLRNAQRQIQKFDIITAWEVLEHIAETDLPQLFDNIRNHLAEGGYFVGSIANWDDIDPVSGVNWHMTVHPYEWWRQKFVESGFKICTDDFDIIDMARGGYNHPQCYLRPAEKVHTETSFYIAVHK